jgi:hypothetical protein
LLVFWIPDWFGFGFLVFPGSWIISIDQLLVQSYSPTPVCTMALTPIFQPMVNTALIVNHRIRHWENNVKDAGRFTHTEIHFIHFAYWLV